MTSNDFPWSKGIPAHDGLQPWRVAGLLFSKAKSTNR
jgi:hypothetical protein